MAIQIIPIQQNTADKDAVVIANAAVQILTEDTLWKLSGNDLTIGATVPYRSGSWASKFVLTDVDKPPLIEWIYSDQADNNATVVVQNSANRATLRVSNIDVSPDPKDVFPDSLWEINGLDLIPK